MKNGSSGYWLRTNSDKRSSERRLVKMILKKKKPRRWPLTQSICYPAIEARDRATLSTCRQPFKFIKQPFDCLTLAFISSVVARNMVVVPTRSGPFRIH